MIQSVRITNHLGESLLLELRSPEKSGFFIKRIDGLGPPKSIINTTEVLSADGGFYNSSKISSRNIILNLGFYNDYLQSIETIRQQTYRYFPMKKSLTIEIQTDNRLATTTCYVESNEPNVFSRDEDTSISLFCPSSFFYEKTPIQTVFSGVIPLFEFPFENLSLTESLLEFGSVFIDTQQTVLYEGDEETGITIYINVLGNVNNLTIFNVSQNQSMAIDSDKVIELTGSDFKVGDQIFISTIQGDKYVYLFRDAVWYNLLNALDQDVDWFKLYRGDNVFTYDADSGMANLQFLIQHRTVYGGL